MIHLALIFLRGTLHVTVLSVATMLLYLLFAGRKKPLGSLPALMCLAVSAVLFGLAFAPLPSWWECTSETSVLPSVALGGTEDGLAQPNRHSRHVASSDAEARQGLMISFRSVWEALPRKFHNMQRQVEQSNSAWSRVLVLVFLGGVGFSSLRLLLGLVTVWRCCRASEVVRCPQSHTLLQTLCTDMGISTKFVDKA